MAFALIIKADSSPIEAIFARLNQFEADKFKMFDEIGVELAERVRMRFFNGVGVDGNPWKQSWRAKAQNGQTGRDTGALMNSLNYQVLANGVVILPDGTVGYYDENGNFVEGVNPNAGESYYNADSDGKIQLIEEMLIKAIKRIIPKI